MKIPPIGYVVIAGTSLFLVSKAVLTIPDNTTSVCDWARNIAGVSCGEEIILVPPGGKSRTDKQNGFNSIKQKDYSQGMEALQKDWELARDPETLIAINNTKLSQDPTAKIKTIAVVVPSSQTPIFVATSILKGVAEAQRAWNQSEHTWKLRVVIADDSNDPQTGAKIATDLTKNPEILAVLGHYSSNVTVNVRDIYQQAKLVLLSATSTADELTSSDQNGFFFRMVSSNQVTAKDMAKKWASKYEKIVLFYTPNKKFSESMRKAFLSEVPAQKNIKEFDLTIPNNAAQEIAAAKALGAKAIVIIPDAYTDPIERDRVLSIIKANQGQLPILGASILRDTYFFQLNPQWLQNLVISTPIYAGDRQYIDAGKLNQVPNWWGDKMQLHDRIINSYDSTQVLIAALDKADDRLAVQKILSSNAFSVRGITGKISFHGSDRAENINSLVVPSCDASKCEGFKLAF